MARGPKKHLKRVNTPKSWLLDKTSGKWATRSSQGPHKLRESVPLSLLIQHRLKYALVTREVNTIVNDKEGNVKIDNKTRRDSKFPCGIMDVLSLEKTNENFRVLFDTRGRFILKSLKAEEAKFKLCKVVGKKVGANKVPYIVTHDGRTIRYPHPDIDVNDTIKLDLLQNKVVDHIKFELGQLVIVTQGNNKGRIGQITARDRHLGSFDIVNIKDARGKAFATRLGNIIIIGKGKKPEISLPKEKGLYFSTLEKQIENESKTKKTSKA